jgi:hypothetical protein
MGALEIDFEQSQVVMREGKGETITPISQELRRKGMVKAVGENVTNRFTSIWVSDKRLYF